jgi:hypothetical protein
MLVQKDGVLNCVYFGQFNYLVAIFLYYYIDFSKTF